MKQDDFPKPVIVFYMAEAASGALSLLPSHWTSRNDGGSLAARPPGSRQQVLQEHVSCIGLSAYRAMRSNIAAGKSSYRLMIRSGPS